MQSVAEVLNFYNMVNRSIPGPKSYRKLPGFEPCRKVYDSCALQLRYNQADQTPTYKIFIHNFFFSFENADYSSFENSKNSRGRPDRFSRAEKTILVWLHFADWTDINLKKSSNYGFLKMVFYYAIIENWRTQV